MKYHANYNANNGTRLMIDMKSDNKKQLMKDIREIATAECFDSNHAIWWVVDRKGHYIYSGMVVKENGKIYYYRNQH